MKMSHLLSPLLLVFLLLGFSDMKAQRPLDVTGAWQSGTPAQQNTMICSERYFAVAMYDLPNKKFIGTYGGSYRIDGDGYVSTIEFHSLSPETIGREYRGKLTLQKNILSIGDESGNTTAWNRIDNGTPGKLAGAWLITCRVRNGEMAKMTPGARRTMKILSGTRFQWIAYNVDTKEFSGTGGGTYTTRDGKYTENIEFFSRDNSRVGASLAFDYSLENGQWRHKGKSSKGDPIDEQWTKREKIGL